MSLGAELACPRCGSPQKFGQQRRTISDDEIEVFARCTTCRWETVLYRGSAEKYRLLNDVNKLKRLAQQYEQLEPLLERRISRLKNKPR